MKRILSFVLCAVMLMSCCVYAAGADEAQAKLVFDQIAALTKDSTNEEIDAAEDAYYNLSSEDQALVTNFAHIEEVRNQKKDPAAEAVVQMIALLGENSTDEEINAAVAAYEALTDEQKAQVWNYSTITDICKQKAAVLVGQINDLPDVYFTDIYHHESLVKNAMKVYDALVDEAKEAVTNYDKLKAISDRIDSLYAWNENKAVNILNNTLAAMGKYTQEDIDAFAAREAVGLYYYFEEVDWLERGDPTTGYFSFEDNSKIADQRYLKLDFDLKVTDVDVVNGWPMPFKFTTNDGSNGYTGYDFINKSFWHGTQTHISHGAVDTVSATKEAEMDFGVWHHYTIVCENEKVAVTCDGETVFEATTPGIVDYIIIYPWLCNLEMTNVVYTDKFGAETLSPFRNAVNTPTGWSKKGNDKDAVMLDHVKVSVEEARAAYEALTDEQKAQIVGIEVLDKVSAMIERVGKNDIVVTDGTASAAYAAEGETVTVTAAEAPEGKMFDKWEIVSGEITLADANAAVTTFTMPAAKVELKATYKDAYTLADVNGDGKINARDISAIMKHILGNTPEGFISAAADVNGDSKINARDITAVMNRVLG